MSTLIENAVTLTEVAKATKISAAEIDFECKKLNVFVGVDWAERPAIATADAYGITTGLLRKEHEHATAWHAYREAAEQWTKARDEAYMAVTRVPGKTKDDKIEAGRAAARQFEEENPPPLWEGSTTSMAEPKYLSAGFFRRTLDKLAGVA